MNKVDWQIKMIDKQRPLINKDDSGIKMIDWPIELTPSYSITCICREGKSETVFCPVPSSAYQQKSVYKSCSYFPSYTDCSKCGPSCRIRGHICCRQKLVYKSCSYSPSYTDCSKCDPSYTGTWANGPCHCSGHRSTPPAARTSTPGPRWQYCCLQIMKSFSYELVSRYVFTAGSASKNSFFRHSMIALIRSAAYKPFWLALSLITL